MALMHDRAGTLYVGTMGGGLCRMSADERSFTRFLHDPRDSGSLGSNRVTCLFQDKADRLWIGTDGGGLSLMDGDDRFQRIAMEQGLPSNVVNGIQADDAGRLWISTNRGLDRYHPDTGEHRVFGPAEGLQVEYNAGIYTRDDNGVMYFGGPKGFDYFHPDEIRLNPNPAPVVLTSFKVFNREMEQRPAWLSEIELTYKQNYFSFEFAAMEFTNPAQNRFAYKMEGFDRDWIESGTRNFAGYTNLDGGVYTFRVKAGNNDGLWTEDETRVTITIVPPFWKKTWFHVLVFLGSISAAAGTVYLIGRKEVKRVEAGRDEAVEMSRSQSRAREEERLRLAGDLHDGPIQDLHAIQLQLSMVKHGKDPGEINDYLRRVIHNLRRLCGKLRPPALGHFGLGVAIRSHVETLMENNPNLKIHLKLGNDRQELDAETRLALFRICQEALSNAVQHSGCSSIQITFELDVERVFLEIRDDGSGFVSRNFFEFSRKGHFGLLGISERAQAIGGNLEIRTGVSMGTAIRVLVPRPRLNT